MPENHGANAKKTPDENLVQGFSVCQVCHGQDFSGGSVSFGCFSQYCHLKAPHPDAPWRGGSIKHTNTDENNAITCGECHRKTNVDQNIPSGCFNNTLCHGSTAAHQIPYTSKELHGVAARQDLLSCAVCHANKSNPAAGDNPRFNLNVGNLNNGCEQCHPTNAAHPNNKWLVRGGNHTSHMDANISNSCALCHGIDLKGGVGPGCFNCHKSSPLTNDNCSSCHNNPPTSGKHNIHLSLNLTCNDCHNAAGVKTAYHYDGKADVFFVSKYNSKNATGNYNSNNKTCSNISCHGGQETPDWNTGVIIINNSCSLCHEAGTTQYNSYFSGKHNKHIGKNIDCTECHDVSKLETYHFNDLGDTSMSEAYKTIIDSANYSGNGGGNYGSCTLTCHGKTHNKEKWQ